MAAWPTAAGGTGPSPVSKVHREIGGGPVPGHCGPVGQLLQAVAPPAVQIHMGSHGGSEVKVDVVDIYIGGWGGESNREIVSFVRASGRGEAKLRGRARR